MKRKKRDRRRQKPEGSFYLIIIISWRESFGVGQLSGLLQLNVFTGRGDWGLCNKYLIADYPCVAHQFWFDSMYVHDKSLSGLDIYTQKALLITNCYLLVVIVVLTFGVYARRCLCRISIRTFKASHAEMKKEQVIVENVKEPYQITKRTTMIEQKYFHKAQWQLLLLTKDNQYTYRTGKGQNKTVSAGQQGSWCVSSLTLTLKSKSKNK